MLQALKQAVVVAFKATCNGFPDALEVELRRTPNPKFGDLAVNCSPVAKQAGQNPVEFAQSVAEAISNHPFIAEATQVGAYVNFRLKPEELFRAAIQSAQARDAGLTEGNARRVMVEYMSPNTNKPLHLGHLRNGCLGSSLANILEATGHSVVRANLVNDRGVHICKSMLAWQKFANGATPDSTGRKGDHFVGDWYVRFVQEAKSDPSFEEAIHEMLRQWEAGDPAVISLWQTMNSWVYQGFAETYQRFGFRFDKMYYESELYRLGKDIVVDGLAKGVFHKQPDGPVVFVLDNNEFGLNTDGSSKFTTLLRADGTSVYITQDIGTAVKKVDDFALDQSIYVVACEQQHHFGVLFAILRALGYPWAEKCYHMSYAMVELPHGKMKSREGTVVDADDLADEMAKLAAEAIRERHKGKGFSEDEIAARAGKIAIAAIKFYLLRFDPGTTIKFDPKKSLAFEGDTGPYCLYAYVRARSILEKARRQDLSATAATTTFSRLGEAEERVLALNLIDLPVVIQRAAASCNPAVVAGHVLELARSFSAFYAKHPAINDDRELAGERLALVQATGEALRWGLSLLGIETLDAM